MRNCPYCGISIDKEPKGKFKCPSCKGEVYPEKKEGLIINLITKTDYETLQVRKKEQASKNKYFRFFDGIDVSESYLEQRRIEWIRRTNQTLDYDELVWSISNELLLEFGKKNLFREMSNLYFSMALFQYNHDKDFFHLLYESRKMELYDYRAQMIKLGESKYKVQILADLCLECLKLDYKTFTMNEALEQMPIPHKGCTNDGWCTCLYAVRTD